MSSSRSRTDSSPSPSDGPGSDDSRPDGPQTDGSQTNGAQTDGTPTGHPPTDGAPGGGSGHPSRFPQIAAALAGAISAVGAIATGEFIAALASPRPGPVLAVANRVVDRAPGWFVEFGKSVFGLSDKAALLVGTTLIVIVIGAITGLIARRHRRAAVAVFLLFGLVSMFAIGTDAQAGWVSAFLISAAAVLVGLGLLKVLLSVIPQDEPRPQRQLAEAKHADQEAKPADHADHPAEPIATPGMSSPGRVGRRSFLGWAALGTGAVVGLGLSARTLRSRSQVDAARSAVELPGLAGSDLAEAVAQAEQSSVAMTPGISPIVVPNSDFYRIDTALVVPRVDPTSWSLRIHGLVDNVRTYSYEELLERASIETPVTLTCVSNEVGGDLVGNAIWRGVPLAELLDEAGVRPEADQLRSASVDGWDCGFPTEAAFDGRTALVAVAMNDEPLPVEHGFPARLVIAGLYGYVSATKWLSEIELTTMDAFNGYWIPRGWSKLAPIKTQSRIDTPRGNTALTRGETTAIAGVAWAPNTGIDRVEVRASPAGDDAEAGTWLDATLGDSLGPNAWRQWHVGWQPEAAGRHRIEVRATDSSGFTQPSERAAPAPNGATGWHTIEVDVT